MIAAEGEHKSSRALKHAADVLMENTGAMQVVIITIVATIVAIVTIVVIITIVTVIILIHDDHNKHNNNSQCTNTSFATFKP